ncbi:hypothetical protein JHK82_050901 [Glycine max]|nr:hypothetical protein JHK86_050756 [Glycine max]KAG5092123.1 hypothetical protein JHK82_050901 [Glycine max]
MCSRELVKVGDDLSEIQMDGHNEHGLDSLPQEEFLSLLGGARTSPPAHQFLVNTLREVGVKLISNVLSGAGKELERIVLDHLQPVVEVIGFRIGELRGLSRWCARYQDIGLDESLINNATEKAGMLLVQILVKKITCLAKLLIMKSSRYEEVIHLCDQTIGSAEKNSYPLDVDCEKPTHPCNRAIKQVFIFV